MIQSIGQVMLYMDDTKAAMEFWTQKAGFVLLKTEEFPDATSYTIAPSEEADVQFVLHNKDWVAKMNPGMNLGIPSILMSSKDIHATQAQFIEKGISANPVVEMAGMLTFNFPDNEGNYFAVRQID